MDRGSTSPKPRAKTGYSIYLLALNQLCLSDSPKRSLPTYMLENKRELCRKPHADAIPTYNGLRPDFPQGIVRVSTPEPSYLTCRNNPRPYI
jgi:hypothetical protein